MIEFDPPLICAKHGEKIDVYCKNPECKLETRICCNTCAQIYHNHQTTRIWELKNVFNSAISTLKEKEQKTQDILEQIKNKTQELSKQINKQTSFLQELIDAPQCQTFTNLIEGIKISNPQNLTLISETVQKCGSHPILDFCIKSKTTNYVKLLEQNKEQEAKQVLKDIIDRYQHNEIYKLEMKRLNGEIIQLIPHLIIQYQSFLEHDQNAKEALKILDQLLERDKGNFIYQRERARLVRQTIEYSVADDNFFNGNYKASVQDCDKLLQIRKDSRICYQKGLSLFYLKQYDNSINSINQAIEIDIENIQYHISKIQLLFAKKDIENLKVEALDLKNYCDSIQQVINGQILFLQEEYEKAQRCFEEAISSNYFSYEAHFLRALCLSKVLNTNEMIITPEQILQNNKNDLPSDMNKFRKYYCMYLEGYNYQNNQFQLSPGRLNQFYQPLMQQQSNGNQTNNITLGKQ
ncbi:unnamed protein product (macronuclear) [Paramecium tetraurelia]|uniref:Tetratricopeptide repeat protein n=1 Tax=Paramecium tetraurelia TaxID=5888 RepID=A0BRN7_PARTE|nr:uncharacterized protein GSPATT00031435001 [Paramecium tetraurelia]CAK61204.1 unnamed protein product [Paramecium tetraurelia]|eukprot:XP_001428602.1 hypothetical protein (macronuclear) [Paramecium tetraurelia strain d4-2]